MARILIADDEQANREILKRQIEAIKKQKEYKLDCEFVEAGCGDEAEKILKERKIDFAVLDEEMAPGKTGSEIARQTKVPCAVYTANRQVYDRLKKAEIPAFRKPDDRWELCNYIFIKIAQSP